MRNKLQLIFTMLREHGNTQAGADLNDITVNFQRLLNRSQQTVSDKNCMLKIYYLGQQHSKFISAHAGQRISIPHHFATGYCYMLQYQVTRMMSQRIVNFLEQIQVYPHECKQLSTAPGTG